MTDIRFCLMLFFTWCLMVSLVYADPFMSYPGTRAKAMGGAFCGIADDASAVWYNPAGIAGDDSFDFIIEWSKAIVQKDETKGNIFDLSQYGIDPDSLAAEKNKFFVSFKFSNRNNYSSDRIGFSLYYVSPYTIDWYFPPKTNAGEAFGTFEEDLNIYGLAAAFSAYEQLFKFGFTLEYVKIDFKPENLKIVSNYNSQTNYIENLSLIHTSANGFSYSFGIISVLMDNKQYAVKLKAGSVYRAESTSSISSGLSSDEEKDEDEKLSSEEEAYIKMKVNAAEKLLFEKPSSFDYGFSLSKGFYSLRSVFLVSLQHSRTDWSNSNDTIQNKYKKTSFGTEWQIASNTRTFFSHFAFRGGWYESKSTLPKQGWPDVKGTTFGIGILYDGIWGLDLTYEDRDIFYEIRDKGTNFSLLSFAVTATWD